MTARYAIYFAPPPDSALWRFGSAVLGTDAASGADVESGLEVWRPDGISPERWAELTADPRVYGFHATIKAPFSLAEGMSEAALLGFARRFCAARTAFAVPGLSLVALPASGAGGEAGSAFLAFRDVFPSEELRTLERDAVLAFEPFRAPLTDADRARRRLDRMDAEARARVERYGYPHVLDRFWFHMTLTGRVPAAELPHVHAALAREAQARVGSGPLPVDALCVFRQEAGGRFRILERCPFGA